MLEPDRELAVVLENVGVEKALGSIALNLDRSVAEDDIVEVLEHIAELAPHGFDIARYHPPEAMLFISSKASGAHRLVATLGVERECKRPVVY